MSIKHLISAIFMVAAAGCAVQAPQELPSGWKVVPDIGLFEFSSQVTGIKRHSPGVGPAPQDWHVLYLTETQPGHWTASRTGDAGQPGTEAIWLDPQRKLIGLTAAGTAQQTNGNAASVCEKTVDYDRAASGYLACNSAMVSEVKDLGVIFKPLAPVMALSGTKITAYQADVPKLVSALAGVDLDALSGDMSAVKAHQQNAARAQYRQQRLARAAAEQHFQDTATIGSKTLCGMIVNIRADLVEVHIDGTGGERRWTKRSNIRPPGSLGPAAQLHHCGKTYY